LKYFRLMTALPPQPTEPAGPGLPLGEVADAARGEAAGDDRLLLDALLARLDVTNLESAMAGRPGLFDPRGALSREEIAALVKDGARAGSPAVVALPFIEGLVAGDDARGRAGGERPGDSNKRAGSPDYAPNLLWKAYFEYLNDFAREQGSSFLTEYAAWETPLVNALARQRASNLGWDSAELVLSEDPLGGAIHDSLISRVSEEADPMERERLLDKARLEAIESFSGGDPFGSDALLALVAAALVLDRWDLPESVNLHELLEVST